MLIRRNAMLAGLTVACLIFLCLTVATRLQPLIEFLLALVGGGAIFAASNRRPARMLDEHPPVATVTPPSAPPPPPPVPYQSRTITGVRLPSALADYDFDFSARLFWQPTTDGDVGVAEIAVNEIIDAARRVTEGADPGHVSVITVRLAVALEALHSDPVERVRFRADSVQLQLAPEDQQRLERLATLRKDEDFWENKRRHEVSRRRYLHSDVLKDPGSAVVWWFAKHEDQPQEVAENIEVLSRLAHAANDRDGVIPDVPDISPQLDDAPETPAERFDAFLDSLGKADDDFRLTLTGLVARFVDGLDQKAADEMRQRYPGPGVGEISEELRDYPDDGYIEYPGDPEDIPPE